jgi:hypothetical protein
MGPGSSVAPALLLLSLYCQIGLRPRTGLMDPRRSSKESAVGLGSAQEALWAS